MVEVMVAAGVLLVGVLAMLNLLDVANATTSTTRARDIATTVARQVTEAARSVPYAALTPQTVEEELQTQPGLASTEAGTWVVERQGIEYAIAAAVCSVDDPSDETGAHDPGIYCSDSGAPGTGDRNPDDYKRVTVDLAWTVNGRDHRLHQVAVVNHPGSSGGPAVSELVIEPPAGEQVLDDLPAVAFRATTTRPATSVSFSVDGVRTATANGPATQWNFSWPIAGLVDGTHLVTAQAFDTQGLSGATRSLTVTLNRFVPAAPTGLAGGRNGAAVELEWLPNPERDVIGYRAFRGAPESGGVLVCPLTRRVSCADPSPPEGELTYYVVADDLSPAGEYRDGQPSTPIQVPAINHAPYPPTNLSAVTQGGTTTLQWSAPSPALDEDHEPVAFYRIYRDGTGFANRYDRTGGAELSIVDGRTDGVPHQYWVSAVDIHLAESVAVGPVTG